MAKTDKAKKTFPKIILAVCLALLVVCLAFFGVYYYRALELKRLSNEVSVGSSSSPAKEEKVEVPVDFEKLKAANSDIYAWINIPNANVDYPILQSGNDNAYYLKRTVNKKWSVYGSIYTEDYNKKDFSDFNTVIYGHNMKNGTMFGSLKKFRDATFFKENRYINVYMENRILKYEIFAACTWDNIHILASRNFDLEQNRAIYLEEIFSVRDMKSQIDKSISVTAEDKIITLSTCMNDESKRFLVSGVLVYDSQNP